MVVGGKEEEGGGDEGAREDEEEALLTEEVGGGGSEEGGGAGLLLRGLAGVGGIVGVGRDLVLLVQAGLLVELLHGGIGRRGGEDLWLFRGEIIRRVPWMEDSRGYRAALARTLPTAK